MAKDCLFYVIQYDDQTDSECSWYTGIAGPFRATKDEAAERFERERKSVPEWISVRLLECRVVDQVNGHHPIVQTD